MKHKIHNMLMKHKIQNVLMKYKTQNFNEIQNSANLDASMLPSTCRLGHHGACPPRQGQHHSSYKNIIIKLNKSNKAKKK